jgi:hypothetical protein
VGSQDAITGSKVHPVKRHVPCPRRILDDRYLVRIAVQESRQRFIGVLDRFLCVGSRFVSPDVGFLFQVMDLRIADRLGRQGGSCIVEVEHV